MLSVNAPGPLVVEPGEQTPAYECPVCVERRLRGHPLLPDCPRCRGARRVGVEGPLPAGVALDEHDRGRFYAEGQLREPGESVYALHICPYTAGAAAA